MAMTWGGGVVSRAAILEHFRRAAIFQASERRLGAGSAQIQPEHVLPHAEPERRTEADCECRGGTAEASQAREGPAGIDPVDVKTEQAQRLIG
jgi:hypothetical protein